MRISDWSSDVCSSDLLWANQPQSHGNWRWLSAKVAVNHPQNRIGGSGGQGEAFVAGFCYLVALLLVEGEAEQRHEHAGLAGDVGAQVRSEEHTSEQQPLLRIT